MNKVYRYLLNTDLIQHILSNRPRSGVIVSFLHQVVDVSHPDFLNIVSLNVLEADLRRHQGLLSVSDHERTADRNFTLPPPKKDNSNTNLIFLLLQQPVDVVVLVALLGHDDVFGADDVEEGLSLRMLC